MPVEKDTRELLAWYMNGTLTGAERERVEALLQADASGPALLAWEQAVRAAIKSDPQLEVAADRGLFQVMQRIRADARPVPLPPRAARGGWFSGVAEKFQWSPVLALACGVVAVQFAVIAQMWTARGESLEFAETRAIGVKPATADAFIRVAFKPEATGGEMTALLRALRAEVVSGPSQLGDYYVLVAKNAADDALGMLIKSANVESAEIVNALPARH